MYLLSIFYCYFFTPANCNTVLENDILSQVMQPTDWCVNAVDFHVSLSLYINLYIFIFILFDKIITDIWSDFG